jgi:hypothetical protein
LDVGLKAFDGFFSDPRPPRGTKTETDDVFIGARFVGISGFQLAGLPPGRHRLGQAGIGRRQGDRAAALKAMARAEPELMQAAQRNIIQKNNASRKVSRLAHQIAKLAK